MKAQCERLPSRRTNVARSFWLGGTFYRATAGHFDEGRIAEIFLQAGKVGSTLQSHCDTEAILVSLLLQFGVDVEVIKHSATGPIAAALSLFTEMPAPVKAGQ